MAVRFFGILSSLASSPRLAASVASRAMRHLRAAVRRMGAAVAIFWPFGLPLATCSWRALVDLLFLRRDHTAWRDALRAARAMARDVALAIAPLVVLAARWRQA